MNQTVFPGNDVIRLACCGADGLLQPELLPCKAVRPESHFEIVAQSEMHQNLGCGQRLELPIVHSSQFDGITVLNLKNAKPTTPLGRCKTRPVRYERPQIRLRLDAARAEQRDQILHPNRIGLLPAKLNQNARTVDR